MVTQVREWTGLKNFPVATQTVLHGLLGKLRQNNINSITLLLLGKGGVGKSSTVNSLIGEKVAIVSAFQPEPMRSVLYSRARAGFTLNVIDTPGLVEGLFVNDHALENIKRFLLNKTIDVMIYVDRLDTYRVDNLDRQIIRAITQSFGPQIWNIGLLALTHAQLSPPDGIGYSDFVTKRSSALQETIQKEAGLRKLELQVPLVLVENSSRCTTNENSEKIIPDGTIWLPKFVGEIVGIVMNDSKSILIDQKLMEGPNANKKGKFLIPFLLIFQYFFVLKPIQMAIRKDADQEAQSRPSWETRAEKYTRKVPGRISGL